MRRGTKPGVGRALVVLCVLASSAALAGQDYGLLKATPDSKERRAPIEALKAQAPELAKAFASHVYQGPKGERMPYRLFTPARGSRSRSRSARTR
jgi:hypothetical protein